jgi:O-antigen/teichoic acid export membrane protein
MGFSEDLPLVPPERELDAATMTTSSSVLRGGTWFFASYAVPQIYTVVISVAAARFLGGDLFGRQSYIAFISITLVTLLSASMYIAVLRYVGETVGAGRTDAIRGLLDWAWRVEGVAALLACGVLCAAAALGAAPQAAWVLAGVISALAILQTVPTAILIGLQRFRQAAVVGLVTGLAATVATVIVLWQGGGITGMFAVETVIAAANLVWTSTIARSTLARLAPDPGGGGADLRRKVGRYALIDGIGVLLDLVVATRSEFFFLNHYSTDLQIGVYSIAFAAVSATRLVPSALGSTIAPAFATLFGASQTDRIRSGYVRAFRLLVAVSLPIMAATIALGPALIRLVWGTQYAGVGSPLRILATVLPFMALSSLAGAYLAGIGRVRVTLGACAIAAVVDLSLAFLLVPSMDASGAALANAGGQLVYALYVLIASSRLLGRLPYCWPMLARSAVVAGLSGAAAFGVLWAVGGPGGLAAGIAVFAVVYVGLAVLVRVLTAEDAAWLETTIGGRVGGAAGRAFRHVSERNPLGAVA